MNILLFLFTIFFTFIKNMIDAYYLIYKIVRKNILDENYKEQK